MPRFFISVKKLSAYLDEVEEWANHDYHHLFEVDDSTREERGRQFFYMCGNCNAVNAIRAKFGIKSRYRPGNEDEN